MATQNGIALVAGLLGAAFAWADAPPSYDRQIKPILSQNCFACHGPDEAQRKAELRLDDEASARPVLTSADGDWKSSEVFKRITHSDPDEVMPPPSSHLSLTPEQIALIGRWLEAGARYEKHWAFMKPVRAPVTEVKNTAWPRNPIDYFVLAKLEAAGVAPSPEADRYTLVRRVYLDLIGLPPSPEAVERFVTDSSPLAYERLVDELLASKHFGERWGRHWLDAARYADSNGYSIDGPREIWKYRDWVIDAINSDMPFDQFTIEQLAGDLLPNATPSQRVATGFHRNTMINQEGGIDEEEFRVEAVVDRVNTTGTVFLGLTMMCAECHTHKYDPITQAEYYKLFAFFNSDDETDIEFPTPEQAQVKSEIAAKVKLLSEQLEARFAHWHENELTDWLAALTEEERGGLTAEQMLVIQTPRADRSAKQINLLRKLYQGRDDESKRLLREIEEIKKGATAVPKTMVLAKRAQPRETFVHIQGDFTRNGEKVAPGTPAALHALNAGPEPTRLDLAKWIVDPENPLTARVMVNRYWMHLFGRGIVETENDFGIQGTPPSNPELLDWLATEYTGLGWSTKSIIRKIVTSAAYRQASNARQDLIERDPDNRLLARQSRLRLDAEIIRDSALVVSGLFNPAIGGPSVYPPIPDGVMSLGQVKRDWPTNQYADRYRRAMYTYFWRATPYPSLTVFDATDATVTCTRRNRSNTPLQALTMLNDGAFHELAQGLAARVMKEAPADANARLLHLFRLCVARDPQPREVEVLKRLIAKQRTLVQAAEGADPEPALWTQLARAVMNTDEFITRE